MDQRIMKRPPGEWKPRPPGGWKPRKPHGWPEAPLPKAYRLIRSKKRGRQTHVVGLLGPPWSTMCGLELSTPAAEPITEPVDICRGCENQLRWTMWRAAARPNHRGGGHDAGS